MGKIKNISRRGFIKSIGLASGGLILACNTEVFSPAKIAQGQFNPNLFVQLREDGTLILVASRSEMGNGVRTSLTSVIADEMEADWSRVEISQATGDKKYGDQNTDGSRSIRYLFETMREMGAMARTMLVQAAAIQWGLTEENCYAQNHEIRNKLNNKTLSFGDLAIPASELSSPKKIKLKDSKDFKYIGSYLPSIDLDKYVTGSAEFGLDKRLPGMKFAAISRPPVTFGKVKSFDREAAMSVPGVESVVQVMRVQKPFGCLGGVAAIATNTWAAFKGKEALNPKWEGGENANYNTSDFTEELMNNLKTNPDTIKDEGSVDSAFAKADKIIESEFRTPHLVHAPMEVPNAVAYVQRSKCEVWAPTQDPQSARKEVADYLGLDINDVTINVTFLGGGFGRKSKPDYIVEAVAISKAIKAPVQVVWSREDDIKHSYYHTLAAQYMRASLDKEGNVTGWDHRYAFPSIGSTYSSLVTSPMGWESASATDIPYKLPNMKVSIGKAPAHVRIGWLRSVINIPHGLSINVFIDELASAAGKDPLDFRLNLIGEDRIENTNNEYKYDTARLKHVLRKAAKNADWGKELPEGHAQGIALQYSFLSYVATVVEVSVLNGNLKVHKVHSVIDCGRPINKSTIESQMQGAAIFGMSLAFYGKITAENGIISQENFNDYPMIRMSEAPPVDVEIIDSEEKPTGVGEPGVPPVAPAIINAIFKATGKRYYNLPLSDYGLV